VAGKTPTVRSQTGSQTRRRTFLNSTSLKPTVPHRGGDDGMGCTLLPTSAAEEELRHWRELWGLAAHWLIVLQSVPVWSSRDLMVDETVIHCVTMNGVPFDLSNDDEFRMLLENLLKSSLRDRPETLEYACDRTKAWLSAYALVRELQRRSLLKAV
jgi:hypothetical protein